MDPKKGEASGTQGEDEVIENGVVRFLEDFQLQDGKIPMEVEVEKDGKTVVDVVEKDFSELTGEEQYNVFNDLVESKLEGRFELSEDEEKAISLLREKKTTFEDYVNGVVDVERDKIENHYQSQSQDYDSMPNDVVHTLYLEGKYPNESEEFIAEKQKLAKNISGYDEKVTNIRELFKEQQSLEVKKEEDKKSKERENELDAMRNKVVKSTYKTLNAIAGWDITREDKDKAYDDILSTDKNGISKFQKDVFGKPEEMVKASYLYRNSENLFNRLESYYKGEVAKAFNAGKKAAISGSDIDKGRASFVADPTKKKETKSENEKDYESF